MNHKKCIAQVQQEKKFGVGVTRLEILLLPSRSVTITHFVIDDNDKKENPSMAIRRA
mgnify:CR=1 FL=1